MQPPKGANTDEQLQFDMQLLQIYSKDDVRVIGTRDDIYKTISERSESWETPREPYEVCISCTSAKWQLTLQHFNHSANTHTLQPPVSKSMCRHTACCHHGACRLEPGSLL